MIVGKRGVFKELDSEFESIWNEYEGKEAEVLEFHETKSYTELTIKFLHDDKVLTVCGEEFVLI